jgi:hypothetical protein
MSRRGIPFFCALALAACQIPNPGIDPTPATLNFPIALGLAPGPSMSQPGTTDPSRWLIVVSADFDGRYNQGSVFSLDMALVDEHLRQLRNYGRAVDHSGCAAGQTPWSGVASPTCHDGCMNQAAWFDPTVECQIAEPIDLMPPGGEAWINSFAAGIARSPQLDRFYLPTRTGADLTWFDVTSAGAIRCDQPQGSLRCGDRRRTTQIETRCANRDMTMVGDPTGITVMSLADIAPSAPSASTRDVVVMTMRHGGNPSNAALFIDTPVTGLGREPVRTHVLTNLPSDAINAELEPSTGLTWMNTASPIATRATRLIARIGVAYDDQHPECTQAFAAPSVFLDGVATGFESRDVAFSADPLNRFAYVLSRAPEGILTIDQQSQPLIRGGGQIVAVNDVGFGPSRIRPAMLGGREFLITTCFDGRALWAMRTQPTEVASVVPGFDGAFELVIDESRGLAIVADFKTSVVRLVDLAPLIGGGDAVVLARIGTPRTHVGFP